MTDNQIFLERLNNLLALSDNVLNDMQAADKIMRLRTSTEQLIVNTYGKDSVFYLNYKKIGNWNSVVNFRQIRGLLTAIKEDIGESKAEKKEPDKQLLNIILGLFYKNSLYNWEAIYNLITKDADYFFYEVKDAEIIFKRFIEKGIIVHSGIGAAYNITEEGRKLFLKLNNSESMPDNKTGKEKAIEETAYSWDVFICHSSKDKPVIRKIINDFKNRNISYWFDEDQITPGSNIQNEISKGLTKSKNLLLCFSQNQLLSGWSKNEYQAVLVNVMSETTVQRVIPLVIDDTSIHVLPPLVKNYRGERYDLPDEYERLLNFLEKNKL